MFRQRKFLIYLSVFLSAFLSLPACGSGGTEEVTAIGTPITSTVRSIERADSERLREAEAIEAWKLAETKNYLNGVKAQRDAEAAQQARKRAAERSPVQAASVAPQSLTAPSEGCRANTSKTWDEARSCWWDLIASYRWPAETMFGIMFCESHGNPNAYNKTPVYSNGTVYHAQGLMQILNGPYGAEESVALAFSMWMDRGTQPWRACGG